MSKITINIFHANNPNKYTCIMTVDNEMLDVANRLGLSYIISSIQKDLDKLSPARNKKVVCDIEKNKQYGLDRTSKTLTEHLKKRAKLYNDDNDLTDLNIILASLDKAELQIKMRKH
jgi:hypothetical protein